MADSTLYEQFISALKTSENFQNLPAERQDDIRNRFAEADDEHLRQALEVVRADKTGASERGRRMQEEATTELKEEMRKIQKEEMDDNRRVDEEESEKAAKDALKGLEKPQPEKRKKIFGIF
jgi:hypothetical protein